LKKRPLAIVTMVYNEPEYLPIWLKYYCSQVGAENCYIIDHGTDDGSIDKLSSINIIYIERSPKDNVARAAFVSNFCSDLLQKYFSVIYVDVDEIVIADPDRYHSLIDYSESTPHSAVHAVGFEVQHVPSDEPPIVLGNMISRQRNWVRLWGGECKSVLTKEPIVWSPGFHDSDKDVVFDNLFLFHLRYFDLGLGLKRLTRTRAQPWASPTAGEHQRWDDEKWVRVFTGFSKYPRKEGVTFSTSVGEIREKCDEFLASTLVPRKHYKMDLNIYVHELWRLPEKFLDMF